MDAPKNVARLALMLRVAYTERHRGPAGVEDDIESEPGRISLAVLEAGRSFNETDWKLADLSAQPAVVLRVARTLVEFSDETRAEALLHCHQWRSRRPWCAPFSEHRRWAAVEKAIRKLEGEGFTASRDDVEVTAVRAYRELTGKSHEQYLDEFVHFPESVDALCPSCGESIPPDRIADHLAGLDGATPECSRQDLEKIAGNARAAVHKRELVPWSRPGSPQWIW